MNIEYLGHAGFQVTTSKGRVILFDPWFGSAFFDSWYPYPDNTSFRNEAKNCDYVFISHEHEDHFDSAFLQEVKANIIIPKYRSNSFRLKCENKRIPYMELEPRVRFSIDEFEFLFVIQSAPAWDDAAIIAIDTLNDEVFVNMNDMKPSADDVDFIENNFKRIDILAYQFSGANWHPMCNQEISQADYDNIVSRKVLNKFNYTLSLLNTFRPKVAVPSAGPPIFLEKNKIRFNNSTIGVFPHLSEYLKFVDNLEIDTSFKALLPGDNLNSDTGRNINDDRDQIDESRLIKTVLNSDSLNSDRIVQYFYDNWADLGNFINVLNYKILYCVDNMEIMTNPKSGLVSFDSKEDYDLKLIVPSHVFSSIVDGESTWEEAFLSLNVTFDWRIQFNEYLVTYHKYLHSDYLKSYLKVLRDSVNREVFELEVNGESLEIQRSCPHAQGDLSKGQIKDGCLVCPSHGWRFRLSDGMCLDSNARISIKKVN